MYKIAEIKRAPLPDPPEGGLIKTYVSLRCFTSIFTTVDSLIFHQTKFCEVFGLKITVPLRERCPLCRSFFTLRQRAKVDKSINIDEVSSAEYAHNEFWLNHRDLVRTMDSLVEDYMGEDEEREESYDYDDILFTS